LEDGGEDHEGDECEECGNSSSDFQEPFLSEKSNSESENEQQSSREPDVAVEEVNKSEGGVLVASSVVGKVNNFLASRKIGRVDNSGDELVSSIFVLSGFNGFSINHFAVDVILQAKDGLSIADGFRFVSDRNTDSFIWVIYTINSVRDISEPLVSFVKGSVGAGS